MRAEALAEQIVRRGPDVVALQEVSLIRRQSPGDLIVRGTTPATDIELDYLAILLSALERHGGHYAVASQVQDTDVEVPLFTGASFDDVRLTDRDVILVRSDLPPGQLRISNPQAKNFTAALPLPIGGNAIRGWCSIDVQTRGRSFRFITAHLEDILPPGLPNIQLAQAYELLIDPANTTMPVVLAGDERQMAERERDRSADQLAQHAARQKCRQIETFRDRNARHQSAGSPPADNFPRF
jgi:endonuclease/exonuclease/phosphatase family metal-dependent hydrolase